MVLLFCQSLWGLFRIEKFYLLSNIRQLEVDEIANVDHGRKYEIVKTITSIRTLAHDVCLQGYSSWQVLVDFVLIVH